MNITLEKLRSAARTLERNRLDAGHFVVIMHSDCRELLCKASARQTWYAQHRENRLAKRTGRTPREIEREFTPETGVYRSIRLIDHDRPARDGSGT